MLGLVKRRNFVKAIEDVVNTDPNTIDNEMPYNTISKMFTKEINKYFRAIAKENNWSLITKSHSFCGYYGYFRNGENFIYVSISDFRFWNWKEVLYRTARNERDYTGGGNHYCDLLNIEEHLIEMFEEDFK